MPLSAGQVTTNGCNGETPCSCQWLSENEIECTTDRGHRYVHSDDYDSVAQNEHAVKLMEIDLNSIESPAMRTLFIPGVLKEAVHTMYEGAHEIYQGAVAFLEDLLGGENAYAAELGDGKFGGIFMFNPFMIGGPVYYPFLNILSNSDDK